MVLGVGRSNAAALWSGLARIGLHLRRGAAAYGVLSIALLLTLLASDYVRQNVEAQAAPDSTRPPRRRRQPFIVV